MTPLLGYLFLFVKCISAKSKKKEDYIHDIKSLDFYAWKLTA